MKLYVCWGTFQTPRPGGHPCHNANEALRMAGYDPEVVKVHGLGVGPKAAAVGDLGQARRSRSSPARGRCPCW